MRSPPSAGRLRAAGNGAVTRAFQLTEPADPTAAQSHTLARVRDAEGQTMHAQAAAAASRDRTLAAQQQLIELQVSRTAGTHQVWCTWELPRSHAGPCRSLQVANTAKTKAAATETEAVTTISSELAELRQAAAANKARLAELKSGQANLTSQLAAIAVECESIQKAADEVRYR